MKQLSLRNKRRKMSRNMKENVQLNSLNVINVVLSFTKDDLNKLLHSKSLRISGIEYDIPTSQIKSYLENNHEGNLKFKLIKKNY